MSYNIQWDGEYSIPQQSVNLYRHGQQDGVRFFDSATLTRTSITRENSGQYVDPTLRLDRNEAQQLINVLWHMGYRPNNGEGTSAQVDAMKAHMEDLRRLIFKDKR